MNGLEALKEIHGTTEVATLAGYVKTNIKQAFKKEFRVIEKELKAFEIIKNALKEMGLDYIISHGTILLHGDDFEREYKCKSQDEFDLLKEVMK